MHRAGPQVTSLWLPCSPGQAGLKPASAHSAGLAQLQVLVNRKLAKDAVCDLTLLQVLSQARAQLSDCRCSANLQGQRCVWQSMHLCNFSTVLCKRRRPRSDSPLCVRDGLQHKDNLPDQSQTLVRRGKLCPASGAERSNLLLSRAIVDTFTPERNPARGFFFAGVDVASPDL